LKLKSRYQVWVFGSRAKSTYKQYSDLDLWVDSQPALSLSEISKLHQLFEESDLAITVDIVTPETCLPEYKNQILSEQKLWFGSSK
jgi:predicted nucleotidyltransferase